MQQALNKVFDLIQRTGDRCIVLSPDGQSAFAVLSLDEYERIMFRKSEVATMSEDELLDKINRDIAIWKSQQEIDDEEADRELGPPVSSPVGDQDYSYPQTTSQFDDWDSDEDDEDEYYFEAV